MSGILRLESLTKGNTLKQGDKTPLKYRLFDADGEKLNIAGKSAKVRLVYPDFLTIGYEKDGLTVAQDDTVTFTIDNVIPSRIYHVEIIVDDQFIFPSRADESKFTVDKSSLGTESNIVEIVGVDAVVRKAVDLINEDPNLIIDEDKLVNDIISNTGIGSIEEYHQQFNDVIKELSEEKDYHSLPEIAGARGGHDTLGQRLDETTAQLAHIVQFNFNEYFKKNTNENSAFQAILDEANNSDFSAVNIFFPKGIYTFNEPIVNDYNIQLTISGVENQTKLLSRIGENTFIQNNNPYDLIIKNCHITGYDTSDSNFFAPNSTGIKTNGNIKTTNVTLQGYQTLIYWNGGYYHEYTNTRFERANIVVDNGNANNVKFFNCRILRIDYFFISTGGSGPLSAINCSFELWTQSLVRAKGNTKSLASFINCYFENYPTKTAGRGLSKDFYEGAQIARSWGSLVLLGNTIHTNGMSRLLNNSGVATENITSLGNRISHSSDDMDAMFVFSNLKSATINDIVNIIGSPTLPLFVAGSYENPENCVIHDPFTGKNVSGPKDDIQGPPGTPVIQKGDENAGFYGFVPPQEFGLIEGNPKGQQKMTASNLALACGLAAGTPINEDTTWAKFSSMGEVIFVPVKPLRSSVSYINIYEAGLVYGDGTNGRVVPTLESGESAVATKQETIVTIGDNRYSVRLMRGAGSDPLDSYNNADRGLVGEMSEWNNLILPLHEKARLQDWAYPAYVGTTEDWDMGLSDADLVTHSSAGTGSYTWCIEQSDVTSTARVLRGLSGASFGNVHSASNANSNYAWRPALVLLS